MLTALEIHTTDAVTSHIALEVAFELVRDAHRKFNGKGREGVFNRYQITDNKGIPTRFLIYFHNDDKATIMTYDEALKLPTFAKKCKETWKD